MGLSQDQLAQNLGMSFQQIQKYESGNSRIAAGILYRLSKLLNVSVDYFYEGLGETPSDMDDLNTEAYHLIRMFGRITSRQKRRALLTMIEQVAAAQAEDRETADDGPPGGNGQIH